MRSDRGDFEEEAVRSRRDVYQQEKKVKSPTFIM